MIDKAELRKIAAARLRDAQSLLVAGRYDGATYLCGYAIEIGLKLRICKTLRWRGFPETNAEFRDLQSFKTHDFDALLRLSGIENKIKSQYLVEWLTVKRWNPELRYSKTGSASSQATADFILATSTLLKFL
jgi:hypothetical protein